MSRFTKAPNADKLPGGIVTASIQPKLYPVQKEGETSKDYQKRKKKEGKSTMIQVYRVVDAEGLKNVPGFVSEHAKGEDVGVQAGIAAWNHLLANSARRGVTLETAGDSLLVVPNVKGPRYIDPNEAALSSISAANAEAIAKTGKGLTASQVAAMFTELTGTK